MQIDHHWPTEASHIHSLILQRYHFSIDVRSRYNWEGWYTQYVTISHAKVVQKYIIVGSVPNPEASSVFCELPTTRPGRPGREAVGRYPDHGFGRALSLGGQCLGPVGTLWQSLLRAAWRRDRSEGWGARISLTWFSVETS